LTGIQFFRGSDDFIIQKVYLLWLMPVCVGLIMLAASFCHSCQSQVDYNCSLIGLMLLLHWRCIASGWRCIGRFPPAMA
jgi:hypothetical protein